MKLSLRKSPTFTYIIGTRVMVIDERLVLYVIAYRNGANMFDGYIYELISQKDLQ